MHKSNGFLVPKLEQAFREIIRGKPVKNKGIELTKEEKAWLDANHTVRVRVTHWPPYTFNSPEVEGVSIDYWEQFAELFGIDSEYWITDMPFAESFKDLTGENEYYDLHLTLKRTPDRLKKLAMTKHYFSAPWVIIAAKDREDISTIEDLNGKLVAIERGYALVDLIEDNFPNIKLKFYGTTEEAIDSVAVNETAAYMGNIARSLYHINQNSLINLQVVGRTPFGRHQQAIAVRKDWAPLATLFDKWLKTLSSAERNAILDKWVAGYEGPKSKLEKKIALNEEEQAWLKEHPKIRVHNETEWPPFNFAENGKPRGFSIDFMNLVAKKTGLKLDYVTGPSWNEFLEMMKRGDLDVMLNIVKTPERLKYLLYTPSYADNPNVILSKNDKPYESIESLFGKTVATPKGFFTEEILKREYPQITVLSLKNMLESMKAVSFGQADAALGELAVFNHLLNQHMMTDMSVSGEADLGDPELSLLHIATRKEHPVLASILTKGVEAVTQEERNALLAKWLMVEKETTILNITAEERAWIKGHPVIKVSNEMDWRPFDFNEDGAPSGYSIDLIKLLAKRIGIQLEFVHGPTWEEFLESLKEKKIDVVHSAIKTEDREKYSLFTDPYMQTISRFIVHKDSPEIRELSDLKGKIFAAPKGWASLEYLKKNRPDIKLLETDSVYDAFNAVMLGKADATAERDKVAKHYISYYGLSDLKVSSWFREFDQNKATGLHAMVRDNWPILKDLLDKALASLTIEEKLALESRWFGEAPVVDEDAQIFSQDIVFNQAALLIKWVAISFAILVLLMVVYWFAKGRPTQFSIRLTLLFISTIFAGLIVAIGLLVLMLLRGEQRQEEIENNRYESIQLAYELKQSSDDLTRFARTYVVTGDPKYAEYFQAIIDIRDGKQAHPKNYSHIYWDQVSAGLVEHNAEGETYSLEQRMVELGMSDEEIGMLRQSKYASDELINLEDVAMNMVRGVYYKDDEDRFTVKTKPNMALARALLHGEKYHAAKANIMRPINEVFVLLKKRTEKELETERANNKAILLVIAGLIVVIIVFSAYTYMLFRRRMVKPLEILKGGALRIEGGDYLHQITLDSQDEMGDLGRAFNAMAHSVHDRNQRLEYVFAATKEGIWDWDIPTDQALFSPQYFHMLGYMQDDFPEKTAKKVWVELLHPDDKERAVSEVGQYIDSGESFAIEFRMRCKDGSYKWILSRAKVVAHDANGNAIRMIGSHSDITERKKAEEEIQAAKDHAEAANRSKSAFLANMSHELRTPLNAVLGFSQLMHSDKTLTTEQRTNLDIINNSGQHLLQLIDDVLDMSKIEAGKIVLMAEDIDLGELIRDVNDMLQVRAEQKGLQLILDQSSDFPSFARADGPKIRQILINLLSNAIKFTDRGSVTLRLSAEDYGPDRITLYGEVEDTGRGIVPEDIERIFQPFEQLAAAVEQKGTGLGLSLTRQFIEMMEGEISATSEPGKGSIFRFHIQVEPGKPELVSKAKKEIAHRVIGLREPSQEWRILIAEDDPVNQLLLQQLLKQVGFKVRVANNGERAVEIFQEWNPHFIWMDRRMPRMDGLAATRHIRELPGGKDVKVAFLTASVFKDQETEVMAAGGDDFLRKPFIPEDLYNCMARHLGLQYLYEEEEARAISPEPVDIASIGPERIVALPAEVREALGKAATRLDIDQAGAVVKQVEEVDPELAAALSQLVDQLDFYAIKKLLNQ
ncbi:MAG: transporter substrate-binding domain-containing protein [Candidatus Sedimenticola sp. (ex Thyasira tokunagai)]